MPHIGLEWEAIEVRCWQQNFCPELYLMAYFIPRILESLSTKQIYSLWIWTNPNLLNFLGMGVVSVRGRAGFSET